MMGKVLVWGGSGGIGAATARALARDGYALHLVGRDPARLDAVADDLGAARTVADVTDPGSFARVAADAGDDLAGLVYAVGSITLRPLPRLTAQDFAADFALNATGAALAVQAALPALRAADGGSVVLFSTVAVNAIAPSLTDTALARGLTGNPQMAQSLAQMHPIPRLGRPEDAGDMAAFLMSDRAGWITGQVIGVDGGRSSLRTRG
jgi:NAD(P)-dependent dehydrogenase (short-subunit alcohol dehydrogenase family)